MTKKHLSKIAREIRALLIELKSQIGDDYRASDGPFDDSPAMCVTVATNDGWTWTYQTGDNSYSGGCYDCAHWSVQTLTRRSNCTELAREIVSELEGMVLESATV